MSSSFRADRCGLIEYVASGPRGTLQAQTEDVRLQIETGFGILVDANSKL